MRDASAVKHMRQRNVLSAPVVNNAGKIIGMVEAQELVSYLAEVTGPGFVKANLRDASVDSALQHGRAYVALDPTDKVSFALELLAKGYHR